MTNSYMIGITNHTLKYMLFYLPERKENVADMMYS
jgi:hypothetical protein